MNPQCPITWQPGSSQASFWQNNGLPPQQFNYNDYPPTSGYLPQYRHLQYRPEEAQQEYYRQYSQNHLKTHQQQVHNLPVHIQQPQRRRASSFNCPPGLEYLLQLDHIFVKQKKNSWEEVCCDANNRYDIFNVDECQIYRAVEDSDCCTLNWCGALRPFEMSILDDQDQEVLHLDRPLRCIECPLPICMQTMDIYSPRVGLIGRIDEQWTCLYPEFKVFDSNGDYQLLIRGPACNRNWTCKNFDFKVLSAEGEIEIGKISRLWMGHGEMFTSADNFGVSFPMDLDVKMKATLLGAVFLIDFIYFEKRNH